MEIKHEFDFHSTYMNPDLRYNTIYMPAVVKEEIDLGCETGSNFYQSSLDVEETLSSGLGECSQQKPWDACSLNTLHRPDLGLYLDSGSHTEKNCVCEICGECFYETTAYKTHMHLHTKKALYAALASKNTLRDQPCPLSLNDNSAEWMPTLNSDETFPVEANSNVYDSRDVCDQTFFYQKSLVSRSLEHPKDRLYSCNICEKTFKRKDLLTIHQSIHSTQRPYACDTCAKTFKQKKILANHHRVHSGQRAFCCDVCSNTFIHKRSLSAHYLVHTKERPYSCYVCKKTFKRKECLKTHQTIHAKERPYSCGKCGKTFKQRKALADHRSVHNEQRAYSCGICSKTFKHKKSLAFHLKNCSRNRTVVL